MTLYANEDTEAEAYFNDTLDSLDALEDDYKPMYAAYRDNRSSEPSPAGQADFKPKTTKLGAYPSDVDLGEHWTLQNVAQDLDGGSETEPESDYAEQEDDEAVASLLSHDAKRGLSPEAQIDSSMVSCSKSRFEGAC